MKTKECTRCGLVRDLSYLQEKVWSCIKDFNPYVCKECYSEKNKKYKQKNKDRDRNQNKIYKKNNREKINQRFRNRYKNDLSFRITRNLRCRLRKAIKKNYKYGSTLELLGCSIEFLKQYLESKFQPGMTWENYGDWHIDHIKPCVSYNLADPEQQKICFHYTNLQPLWAKDNLSKGCKQEACTEYLGYQTPED